MKSFRLPRFQRKTDCFFKISNAYLFQVGAELPPSRLELTETGDFIGTFMAWLKDVDAGGGTAYVYPGFEGTIMPEKGNIHNLH